MSANEQQAAQETPQASPEADAGPAPSPLPEGAAAARTEPERATGDAGPPGPPTKQQLDLVHVALFGWPMDHLTPVPDLAASHDITEATRKILNSGRFRWDARGSVPLWPGDKWVCADAFGVRIWVNLHDGYVSWGVLHEDWENEEVGFVLRHLRPGDTFLDIGANVGVYTLQAARAVGPGGHVYSIEPRPDTCAMLARSIADNGFAGRCTVFNVALGPHEMLGDISTGNRTTDPGATFVVRRDDGPVRICPLDSLPIPDGRPVKVLKMDIEGYEPLMMEGARAFFRKHRPIVLTEIFPRAIRAVAGRDAMEFFDQFMQLGYVVHRLEGSEVGSRMERADVAAIFDIPTPFNIVCLPGRMP